MSTFSVWENLPVCARRVTYSGSYQEFLLQCWDAIWFFGRGERSVAARTWNFQHWRGARSDSRTYIVLWHSLNCFSFRLNTVKYGASWPFRNSTCLEEVYTSLQGDHPSSTRFGRLILSMVVGLNLFKRATAATIKALMRYWFSYYRLPFVAYPLTRTWFSLESTLHQDWHWTLSHTLTESQENIWKNHSFWMGYCSGYCWYLRIEIIFFFQLSNNPSNNPRKNMFVSTCLPKMSWKSASVIIGGRWS